MTLFTSPATAIRPVLAWLLVAVGACGFIAAFISLQAGFFALLFTGIAWYAWRYPEEGFLLLLIMIPLLPMLKITQTIGTFSLVKDIIILTLCMKLCVVPFLGRRLLYRRNILLAPMVALAIWAGTSALRAESYVFGAVLLRDIVLYMLAYMAVLYLPKHDAATMKRRFQWILGITGVTLLLAGWQWFFAQDSAVLRFDPVREIWIPRISSVLAHPSIYGEYLTAILVLVSGYTVTRTDKQAMAKGIVAAVVLLPFIFLTYSRGVWLAVAAAGACMAILFTYKVARAKVSIQKISTYGAGLIAVLLVVMMILVRTTPAGGLLRSIFDPTYASNEERVVFITRLVAPLTNTQAIIGVGLGNVTQQNFRSIDLEAIDIAAAASRTVQLAKNNTLVDNQHLKTFIEMGFVGLVLYGWIYLRLARVGIRLAISDYSLETQVIGFATIGFLVAFVLQGFLIDIWNIFPTNLLFWIVAALASHAAVALNEKTEA